MIYLERIISHYKTKENYQEIVNKLKEIITEETVIINIGTDKCIADLIGGLVGTILQENNFPLKVFGTIDEPIHALNVQKRYASIKELYPNNPILCIDACLGDKKDIGSIILKNAPLHPGKGVGKKLGEIGDWSIIGITDDSQSNEIFINRGVRLSLVYGISKTIAEMLFEATKDLHMRYERKKKFSIRLFNNKLLKLIS
jgi:putative sporulation protein YyaC